MQLSQLYFLATVLAVQLAVSLGSVIPIERPAVLLSKFHPDVQGLYRNLPVCTPLSLFEPSLNSILQIEDEVQAPSVEHTVL